jgi:hypothetical protein
LQWAGPAPKLVRNGHLHRLDTLLAGSGYGYDYDGNWVWWPSWWTTWSVQDLNNSGVILASVSPTYDHNGYYLDWGAALALQEPALLVPVTMEWVSAGGPDAGEVSDNKTPVDTVLYGSSFSANTWMPGGGQRIFPDKVSHTATLARNKVKLRVNATPAMAGQRVYVKAFDVDDPVTPAFDDKGVLDRNDWQWNGPTESVYYASGESGGWVNIPSAGDYLAAVGNDNRADTLGTPQAGRFVAGGGISVYGEDDEMASGIVNAQGLVDFVFETGMQPGNNYRVAMTLDPNEADFAFLQVDGSADYYGYIGWDSTQRTTSGFGGVLSPMLTVWRKLHVEADTMLKWTGNKPSPDRLVIGAGAATLSPVVVYDTAQQNVNVPNATLTTNFYGGGYIFQDGNKYFINSNGIHTLTIRPITGFSLDVSAQFEIYDDDNESIIPRYNSVSVGVISKYVPAYISVEELPHVLSENSRTTIPFMINMESLYGEPFYDYFQLAASQDMTGSDGYAYWYALLVSAYQHKASLDRDPNTESPRLGATTESIWSTLNPLSVALPTLSSIYAESIRDEDDRAVYHDNVVAHELGHQPGHQSESTDHNEGGIMISDATKDDFSPTSLHRFRNTHRWHASTN